MATLTFLSLTDPNSNGSLSDGSYRLTARGAAVTDGAGRPLDGDGDGTPGGDYALELYRLFGDGNADRRVDNADFFAFRNRFGTTLGP